MNLEMTPEMKTEFRKKMAAEDKERWLDRKEVRGRGFANMHGYSDVHPHEIVRVVSEKTIEVRAMIATRTVTPKNFQVGGFSAHCVDNHAQEYSYESNPEASVQRVRWSERKGTWQNKDGSRYGIADAPYKFYDYNF